MKSTFRIYRKGDGKVWNGSVSKSSLQELITLLKIASLTYGFEPTTCIGINTIICPWPHYICTNSLILGNNVNSCDSSIRPYFWSEVLTKLFGKTWKQRPLHKTLIEIWMGKTKSGFTKIYQWKLTQEAMGIVWKINWSF